MPPNKRLQAYDDVVGVKSPMFDGKNPPTFIGEEEWIYGKYTNTIRVRVRDTFTFADVTVFALRGDGYEAIMRATNDPDSADYINEIGGGSGISNNIFAAIDYCRNDLFSATVTITP